MRRRILVICLALVLLAGSAYGIVIRHDRPDAQYKRIGASYPMVCRVGQGMGILIDSLWVLTSASTAKTLPADSATVIFGRRVIPVSNIVSHPEYSAQTHAHDLALVRLKFSVTLFYHAFLYTGRDEWGELATLVGDGETGDGITGGQPGKRVMRAAHNRVDSAWTGWLRFTFNKPPAGDTLEGIGGKGDEGGPALRYHGDSLMVLGVKSHVKEATNGRYGTQAYYTRISDELEWLRSVIAGQ
jgi:hypothetical protein